MDGSAAGGFYSSGLELQFMSFMSTYWRVPTAPSTPDTPTTGAPGRVHNAGKGAKYTRPRRPVELVYREAFGDKSAALRREREIKRLTRAQKLALIAAQTGRQGTETEEPGQ